jgi:MFS family permease
MNNKKLVLITALAAGLEYYDFIIYGLLSSYLASIFFPNTLHWLANIQVLLIFSLGYFARPVGAVIFGWIGDHYGRKAGFLISMLCIALATFCIGILPNYHSLGAASSILLIVLRLIQGLAYSAELPGVATFLAEHIQTKSKGLAFGLMYSGVSIGSATGTLFIYYLTRFLTHAEMLNYGWRLPFLFGGLLAILNYFMRKKINESPLFLLYLKSHDFVRKNPIKQVFLKHYKALILGMGLTLFGACFIIFGVTLPSFLHEVYHYAMPTIYSAMTFGFILSIVLLPIFGYLSEKIGKPQLLIVAAIFMITTGFIFFNLLKTQDLSARIMFIIFYHLIASASATSYLSALTELFPISVRFTGVAICYNLTFCVASLTPSLLAFTTHLLGKGDKAYLAFPLLALVTILASSILILKNQQK